MAGPDALLLIGSGRPVLSRIVSARAAPSRLDPSARGFLLAKREYTNLSRQEEAECAYHLHDPGHVRHDGHALPTCPIFDANPEVLPHRSGFMPPKSAPIS